MHGNKIPKPISVETFVKYVASHSNIKNVVQTEQQVYTISRESQSDLVVFLTDIYCVSEADVYEIKSDYPKINAIVTVSMWNMYTSQAKALCRRQMIGLYKFDEFLGALNFDDNKFLDYIPGKNRAQDSTKK